MITKSGKKLFPIGIGTWNIAGTFTSDPSAKYKGAVPSRGNEESEIDAIRYSISKGQNHIDCAELYGGFYTDEVVGKAIAGLEREDLYIADKLWKTSVGKGLVRPTVEKMLKKLGTDYLDMLYIHAPWPEVNWQEAIPQIDELIDTGIVRDFGVSNFTIADMEEAQKLAKHPIVANQMNYNILYKNDGYFYPFASQSFHYEDYLLMIFVHSGDFQMLDYLLSIAHPMLAKHPSLIPTDELCTPMGLYPKSFV